MATLESYKPKRGRPVGSKNKLKEKKSKLTSMDPVDITAPVCLKCGAQRSPFEQHVCNIQDGRRDKVSALSRKVKHMSERFADIERSITKPKATPRRNRHDTIGLHTPRIASVIIPPSTPLQPWTVKTSNVLSLIHI